MIRIIVDSSTDYTMDELKEKNMELVPLSVVWNGESYREGEHFTRDEFYERLISSSEFPTTSQPSPEQFLDAFERAKSAGDQVICIVVSSAISGTYQSAMLAKSIADYENIYIIDSLSATHPLRFLADYACQLREENMDVKEIVEKLEALKPHIKIIAALDTLEYLKRGGRISSAAASIGELANVKPLVTLTPEGTVGVLGKALGKNRAVNTLLKTIQAEEINESFGVYTLYTYGTENCEKLEKKLAESGISVHGRLQVGTVIGAHVGPGVCGCAYVTK